MHLLLDFLCSIYPYVQFNYFINLYFSAFFMHKLIIMGAPMKILEKIEFLFEQFLFVGIPLILYGYF